MEYESGEITAIVPKESMDLLEQYKLSVCTCLIILFIDKFIYFGYNNLLLCIVFHASDSFSQLKSQAAQYVAGYIANRFGTK